MWVFLNDGFFFFKQKTAYEMRISDLSSDVCSSDLFIDGFRQADVDAGIYPRQATMWIAPVVAGAPPVPVRVIGASALGNLRLDLVEAWAMDGATAAKDDAGCAGGQPANC